MIKVLEQDLLDDKFIIKGFTNNISLNDKLYFNMDDIYYFGNYKTEELEKIKKKLINNKKRLIKAIEQGIRIIVNGNSCELFNNSFKSKDLNIYTCYNPNNFKKGIKKIKFKNRCKNTKLKTVYDISAPINSESFRYKNFLCIKSL